MYVDPLHERDLRTSAWFTQDVAPGSFDFNWTVTDYSTRNPYVQLDFANYSAISAEEEDDYFIVNITDPSKFYNLTALPELRKWTHCYLNTTIPKQYPTDTTYFSLTDLEKFLREFLKALFITGFVVSFIGNWNYGLSFRSIRTYQIMIHLVMSRVVFPANLMVFLQTIRPIAQCDFLDDFFGWAGAKEPLTDYDNNILRKLIKQMIDLEYDSFN